MRSQWIFIPSDGLNDFLFSYILDQGYYAHSWLEPTLQEEDRVYLYHTKLNEGNDLQKKTAPKTNVFGQFQPSFSMYTVSDVDWRPRYIGSVAAGPRCAGLPAKH